MVVMASQPGEHLTRATFWREYYESVQKLSEDWLDLSNARVHLQTLELALEGAGELSGKRCLDVGCGRGLLSALLHGVGALSVTAVDQVVDMIADNRSKYPGVEWKVASLEDFETSDSFDLVFLVEVLQYVEYQAAIRKYWQLVHPGGRIVVIHPIAECPIVQRAAVRFVGNYRAPTLHEASDVLASLRDVKGWGARGLFFQEDQLITPYAASAWSNKLAWNPPPNRVQAVLVKKEGGRSE